jgi:hypothetical protein
MICSIVFESGIFPAEEFFALLVFTAIVNDLTIVLQAPMSAQITSTIVTCECDVTTIEGTRQRVTGGITVNLGGYFGTLQAHAGPKAVMRRDSVWYQMAANTSRTANRYSHGSRLEVGLTRDY